MSTINPTALAKLANTLRGQVLGPEHPAFDTTREIWNRLYDQRPSLIVRCAGHSDVVKGVRFAREQELEIAVKGGGHHVAGHASCDGGLLLDFSLMRGIQVDPVRQVVTAQAGCSWRDFDYEAQEFGLAATGPIVSMTGLPGFVLGGGFGWLHRKLGLGCDHLTAADLVTADGQYARASLEDDPELLWGLRGAGWNFGVVTSMEMKVERIGPRVLAGLVYFPLERFSELVAFHQAELAAAPSELTTWLILRLAPNVPGIPTAMHGQPVCAIAFCHCGDTISAEQWADRIRNGVKQPFADSISWRSYAEWQGALDARWGNGFFNDWRSYYLDAIEPQCVEVILKHLVRVDSPFTDIKIPHLGGAIEQEPVGGTAFPSANRHSRYCLVIQARWNVAAESDKHLQWARDLHADLRPFSAPGAYPNFLARDEHSRVPSSYGEPSYGRLTALKGRMDPENVFHLNPNIPSLRKTSV